MNKKKLFTPVLSVLCVALIVTAVFAGCKVVKDNGNSSDASGTINVISREDGSGTRDAFCELIGVLDENKNDATTQTAEITNSTSVMMSTVKGNKNAIGYVSLGSLSNEVKALKLNGVAPSAETIKSGDYKLQRPFNVAYIDSKLTDVAKDFLSYVKSQEGEAVIAEEGYIGLDSTYSYKAANMTGTVTLAGSTSVAPVMNVLADKYKTLNPNVKIEIQESGSTAGIESAINGTVNIAMSSRELKEDELKTLKSEEIARDGIAVIVNKQNSMESISNDQLKSVYLGQVTDWEDIK